MPAPDKIEYARTLFERLGEGVVVPLRSVTVKHEEGTWQPEARHCHRNVSILEQAYPDDLEAVRGWLVFDLRSFFGELRFMPHSVIKEKANGRLFDPTPQERLNPDYLFIGAKLVEADYSDLLEGMAHGEMLACRTI